MTNTYWVIALIGLLCASCVPNKRMVIVQDKSLKHPQNQEYKHQFVPQKQECRLESGDVVSVEIDYIDILETNYQRQAGTGSSRSNNPYAEGYSISAFGKIALPILGEIKIEGLEIDSARKKIELAAMRVYSKPTVRIALMNTEVTVLGEVAQPGTYNTNRCGNSIFKSLGLAGGTTTMADLRSVKVIRDRGDSLQVFFIDLSDEKLLNSAYYFSEPGDIIFVKPLKRKMFTFQESQQVFRGLSVILSVAGLFLAISRL